MRQLAISAVVLLAGCGDDALSAGAPRTSGCPDNQASISLSVAPAEVTRGDATELRLTWELSEALSAGAEATLGLGEALLIEVTAPLVRVDGSAPATYAAALLNPYGPLAPAGTITVLAEGRPASGCRVAATAATSFQLR